MRSTLSRVPSSVTVGFSLSVIYFFYLVRFLCRLVGAYDFESCGPFTSSSNLTLLDSSRTSSISIPSIGPSLVYPEADMVSCLSYFTGYSASYISRSGRFFFDALLAFSPDRSIADFGLGFSDLLSKSADFSCFSGTRGSY